jgi:TPR repeat protein
MNAFISRARQGSVRGLAVIFMCLGLLTSYATADSFDEGLAAYNKSDYQKALSIWRPLAEQGRGDAEYGIARMYYNGFGVPRDREEALKRIRRALDHDCTEANIGLGNLYREGKVVPQNFPKALALFQIVADSGNPIAFYNIGLMYETGAGVEVNLVEAVRWYQKAADGGVVPAQARLGMLYMTGQNVSKDRVQALKWFSLSAAKVSAPYYEPDSAMWRDWLQARMTPDEIAEAKRLAAEWKPKTP